MNDTQIAKLQRFMADKVMADAVYQVLLDSFLRPMTSKDDVYVIAASRLSVDFLKFGWRELDKYKVVNEKETKVVGNIGL